MSTVITHLRAACRAGALLSFLLIAFAPSLHAQALLGPGLAAELAAMSPTATTTVIVTFDGPELTDAQVSAVRTLGITSGVLMPEFSMMGVAATAVQVQALATLSGVRSVWPNEPVALYNEESTLATDVDALQSDPNFSALNGGAVIDGRGVTVVINDTGVDGLHPDLQYPSHVVDNVQATMNPNGVDDMLPVFFVNDVPNTDVLGGHGTHVAGTVGGTGQASGGRHAGVAPGADLIGYGSGAGILILDTIGGLYFCITHQFAYDNPIRLVNNSWGPLNGGDFHPDNPVNVATKRLYDRGIISVFAGGNAGPNENTLSPYAAPWVLTVAAGNKDRATLAGFSSRGKAGDTMTFTTDDGATWTYTNAPTITAPGAGVVSTRNTTDAPTDGDVYYVTKSGTSMASPHVAGIAALMLDANPMMTFEDVRDALTSTATPMPAYSAAEAGAGYVNAYAAVAVALGLDPTPYLREAVPTPDGVMLTDPEGDADMAGTDITQAAVVNETDDAFEIVLHVTDLDQATPSTLLVAGLQVGAMQEYGVEFALEKAGLPSVTYSFSAKRTLVSILGGSTVGLLEPSYDYGVRASDGSGRGLGDVEGDWDEENGTITWIVPKAILNVAAPPASLTSQDIDRTGRAAADGDVLRSFTADVVTSFWGGVVGLTPGATRYDDGAGTGSYALGSHRNTDDDGGDGDNGGGGDDDDPIAEHKLIRTSFRCAVENTDGSMTAYFRYNSYNRNPVEIPVGDYNFFTPDPADRGQPTTFFWRRHDFRIDYDGGPLAWHLDDRTAEVNYARRVCLTADLQLDLAVDDDAPAPGDVITFTLTLTNDGRHKGRHVAINTVIPADLTLTAAAASAGQYEGGLWTISSLSKDAAATLTLTTSVDAEGTYEVSAEVITSNRHDPDSTPGNGDISEDDYAAVTVEAANPQPRVVVSVIDSGINPYHDFFNADGALYGGGAPASVTPGVLSAFGIDDDHILRLTRTGDFTADFAADAALWAGVQPGELYWFEGTNILAVSFDGGSRIILPDDEDDTHGVGTTAAVLNANPEAIIVFVEGITDASETFAFTHPEIDLVSTSYGPIGSIPLPYHVTNSFVGVVEQGKLHFGAADNSPSTAIQDGTAGPWWSIGVAGFEEGTSEGKQVLSGSLADFVGDFSQSLPYCAECEDGMDMAYGTSFATPRSAGTASKVLLELRRALGHADAGVVDVDGTPVMAAGEGRTVTNWQLRRALEEAAYYPESLDYDPIEGVFDIVAAPVPPEGQYAVIGWGVLTPDPARAVVGEALARLGVGGEPTRAKGADACTFMTTLMDARHAYWDAVAIESQSWLYDGEDPYVYCGASPSARVAGAGAALAGTAFGEVPADYALDQNYPNPFNPSTTIRFALPESASHVRLAVYDVLGRQVRLLVDGPMDAGRHDVSFEAGEMASGTYLYRLQTPTRTFTRQMVLMK